MQREFTIYICANDPFEQLEEEWQAITAEMILDEIENRAKQASMTERACKLDGLKRVPVRVKVVVDERANP